MTPPQVHLIVSSVQLLTSNPLVESWGHFPVSKARLLALLAEARPAAALVLSGDVHFAEFLGPAATAAASSSPFSSHSSSASPSASSSASASSASSSTTAAAAVARAVVKPPEGIAELSREHLTHRTLSELVICK